MGKAIETKELRSLLLDLLDYYVLVCDSNNLRYFLGGGTILGAVRHNGFIPWDDDIDVMMPRPDYNRFIEIVTKSPNDKYSFIYHKNFKNYGFTFGKLQVNNTVLIEGDLFEKFGQIGVHFDIFPIDGLPDTDEAIQKYFGVVMAFRDAVAIATTKPRWCKPYFKKVVRMILFYTIFQLITPKYIISLLERILARYNYDSSKYVAALVGSYGRKELMDKEQVVDFILWKFEGKRYRIPVGYDKYLRDHYGNYMQLPPIEKQHGHSNRTVYWK